MDDLKKYYATIASKVILMIKENKIEEALELINGELDQPYIPDEFFISLEKTKKDLELQIKEKIFQKEYEGLSKFNLWDKIYNKEKKNIDLFYLNLFFSKFQDELDEIDYSIIEKIFLDHEIENDEKATLISQLVELQIDRSFEYYNCFTKTKNKINPSKYLKSESQIKTIELSNELESYFSKDPSKLKIAISFVQLLAISFIPEVIIFDNKKIVDTIINITQSLFGEEELFENDITKILYKYIE